MRLRGVVEESAASALASRVPSAMMVLLGAATCLVCLLTVGRTAVADRELEARLDDAGSRVIEVTDTHDLGLLTPAVLTVASQISTSERVIGLTTPVDVYPGAIGQGATPVAGWSVLGGLDDVGTLTAGRWPGPDEAVVSDASAKALGLDGVAGFLTNGPDGQEFAVVGTFRPRSPFERLGSGVLLGHGDALPAAGSMFVVVTSAGAVVETQAQVLQLVAAREPTDLRIESPVSLAELQERLRGDLGRYGRALLLIVLGAAAALTAAVVLGDVLIRRADLGRRRALGATRATLILLVTLRATMAVATGACLGVLVGLLWLSRNGSAPPWSFVVGVLILTILCASAAALVPASLAATKDPVRVLRTA